MALTLARRSGSGGKKSGKGRRGVAKSANPKDNKREKGSQPKFSGGRRKLEEKRRGRTQSQKGRSQIDFKKDTFKIGGRGVQTKKSLRRNGNLKNNKRGGGIKGIAVPNRQRSGGKISQKKKEQLVM